VASPRCALRECQRQTGGAGFAFPSSRATLRLNPHPSKTEGMHHPPGYAGGLNGSMQHEACPLALKTKAKIAH
jgi:hypothetical protein